MSERCPITTKPRDRARRRGYDRGWFAARSVGKEKNTRLTHNSLGFPTERHTHRGIFRVGGGHVGCGIMFSSNFCPTFSYLGVWIFFAMDLNRCTRAVSTQHGLHNLPTPPQTGVETGTFRPHPSTQLLLWRSFRLWVCPELLRI